MWVVDLKCTPMGYPWDTRSAWAYPHDNSLWHQWGHDSLERTNPGAIITSLQVDFES